MREIHTSHSANKNESQCFFHRQIFCSDENLQKYFYSFTTLITPSIFSLYSYSPFVKIWTSKKSHCQSRCGLATLRWLILITLQGCKYAKRNTRFFNIKICLNLSKTRERYVYFIDHFFKWKNAKSRQTYSGRYLTSVHPPLFILHKRLHENSILYIFLNAYFCIFYLH